MKAKVSFLIGVMIMISVMVFGQIEVKNQSSANIKVKSIDGTKTVDININKAVVVSFLKDEGGVTHCLISHSTYKPGKGFITIDDGEFALVVTNGKAVFSNPKQRQAVPKVKASETGKEKKETSKTEAKTSNEGSESSAPETSVTSATFRVKNTCKKTITCHSLPFSGLCLKAGATSEQSYEAPTGNLQVCFSYDKDVDSIATGKNRKWVVLDRSIPEGTTMLDISDENLLFPSSDVKARKTFENETDRGWMILNDSIMNGKYTVKTISPNSKQKIDFLLGWNVLSLQCRGNNGFPIQVVIMFLVTEDGGKVKLTEKIVNGKSVFDIL